MFFWKINNQEKRENNEGDGCIYEWWNYHWNNKRRRIFKWYFGCFKEFGGKKFTLRDIKVEIHSRKVSNVFLNAAKGLNQARGYNIQFENNVNIKYKTVVVIEKLNKINILENIDYNVNRK